MKTSQLSQQDLQQKEKLRNILISKGITNITRQDEILELSFNPPADVSAHMLPENRVTREQIITRSKEIKSVS